ncbi:GGDEF domain-containing protein [Rhizobium sp. LjRoot30]|uniref:GGDEF domain-containing protein n=1 Tax=Rhizobium sp. LjRoot30 TaxID=3342320 RepID=UPI003ED12169
MHQTIVNVAVATLFTIAFTLVSIRRNTKGDAGWFAVSYGTGILTPVSELLVWLTPYPAVFTATNFASFTLAFHFMAKGLSVYYKQPVSNWLLIASFVLSLIVRGAIWGGARNTMPYELLYQLPFAVAMGLCAMIIASSRSNGGLEHILTGLFGALAASFIVKSVVAIWLNSGSTASQYLDSKYALFSQSLSAILLIAIALTLLMVLMRDTVEAANTIAEIDPLSQVHNRRGFNERAKLALERSQKRRHEVAFLLFDLDHFKLINDRFGHATGDRVIEKFGEILRLGVSDRNVAGRIGGEEFAVLLENLTAPAAREVAETIRLALANTRFDEPDLHATVSIGIAMAEPFESLHTLCEKADIALYRAKRSGRNRTAVTEPT